MKLTHNGQDSSLLNNFVAEETTVNGVTFAGDTIIYVDEAELDSLVYMRWMHVADAIDLVMAHKTKREYWRDCIEAKAIRHEIAKYKREDMQHDANQAAWDDKRHTGDMAELDDEDLERTNLWH